MILLRFIEFLRLHPKMLLRLGAGLLVLLVVVDALPWVVDKSKAHTRAELIPGFWAAFGLVGCLLLIVVSKTLGKLGLQRKERRSKDV